MQESLSISRYWWHDRLELTKSARRSCAGTRCSRCRPRQMERERCETRATSTRACFWWGDRWSHLSPHHHHHHPGLRLRRTKIILRSPVPDSSAVPGQIPGLANRESLNLSRSRAVVSFVNITCSQKETALYAL